MTYDYDIIICNGILVLESGCTKGDLGIKDGKIVAILETGGAGSAAEVIDASGLYVFPGGIDTHTHFFDPGDTYREDWLCGSMAAAAGGYTTVMEMPNSRPPVIDKKTFQIKYDRASKNSVVDYALWGGAIAGRTKQIEELCKLGCIAFKGFTLDAGPEFRWLNHFQQGKAMEEMKLYHKILGLHAEAPDIIQGMKEENRTLSWNLKLHNRSRPYYAELIAIQSAVEMAKAIQCPLHICHLSIPEGAAYLKEAKKQGVDVTVESCSHYFLLNCEDDYERHTYALIQPPLRERAKMEAMWPYLEDGTIDYLGTDHAPYTKEDKELLSGDGWEVMGGAPSIDIAYPLMISEAVLKRGFQPHKLAALCATNAARRFHMYPQKGAIRIGADADLALMDLEHSWRYTRKKSFSKSKSTDFPYEGKELGCRVNMTFVRGQLVYRDGEILVRPGSGIYIKSKER